MGYVLEFRDAPSGDVFKMAPETALAFFKAKGLQPTFSYADMVREEHDLAFTVAKMMDLDLLKTVQDQVTRAVTEGKSIGAFRRELGPVLKAAGWWGTDVLQDPLTGELVEAQLGSAHRLNTIFRSNLQSAYSVGRWERIVENAEDAPWLMYDAVDDFRTRPEHAKLDSIILPVSDPFWRAFMPPNGYNCRCGVIQLSDRDLARMGLVPSKRPRVKMVDWTNPRTGRVERIPAAIDPGWNHNPGMERFGSIKAVARDKIKTYPQSWQKPALEAIEEPREFFNGDGPEMEWHRSSFDESPVPVKQTVQNADRIGVLTTPGTGAYAMGGRLIEMGSHDLDSQHGQAVWRHEFGHILDVQLGGKEGASMYGYYSSGEAWKRAIKADAKAMTDAVARGRRSKKQEARALERQTEYNDTREKAIRTTGEEFEILLRTLAEEAGVEYADFIQAMKRETLLFEEFDDVQALGASGRYRLAMALASLKRADPETFVGMLLYRDLDHTAAKQKRRAYKHAGALGSLSDLAGATTRNRVASFNNGFPGHSNGYYSSSPHRAPTEAFANITSLMGHPLPFWHLVARRMAPEQAAEWEKLIERHGVKPNE